jgi:flagellar hook-length control protein FliK
MGLQVVNTAAPAIPLDRPQTNASRRPDAGGGKSCDSFDALVDESVRCSADRDDLSTAGRSQAKPSRDDGDEPAAEPDDTDDAPVEAPVVVTPVWVAPQVPVDPVVDPSGVTFAAHASDATGTAATASADTNGKGVAAVTAGVAPPPDATADANGREAASTGAKATPVPAAERLDKAPVTTVAASVAADQMPGAANEVHRDVTAALAEPAIAPEQAAAPAAGVAADTATPSSMPAPGDRGTADAAPVKHDAPPASSAAAPNDTAAADASRPAAPASESPRPAHAAHVGTGAAHRHPSGGASRHAVAPPVAQSVPSDTTADPAPPAAGVDDAPAEAPRFNTRLAGQLQRALRVTGDQPATPKAELPAAPNAASATPAATPFQMPFSGGSGRPVADDTAIGSRTGMGTSAPVPVAPALVSAEFAKFLAATQTGEVRVPSQVLDEVAPQLVQAMRVQVSQGGGEARVHLRPEHLGAVTIDVRVENGRVTASFNAEVPAVRQWLESHEGSLRQGLSEQGLHLERFVVNKDGDSPNREGQQGRDDGRRRQARRGRADEEQVTFEVIV